jgi:ribosomal protein S18 acetylase RimI-like enzyme
MLEIRELLESDCAVIASAFAQQGWNKPYAQFARYLEECRTGSRVTLVAELDGEFAGYVNILWVSDYPPFRDAGIPEIADFNVLMKFQRQGIGSRLMDEVERRIKERGYPVAGIGVGLYPDYGPAQILYIKRGYVPDGRGVNYNARQVPPGEQVTLDDDLTLQLTKKL